MTGGLITCKRRLKAKNMKEIRTRILLCSICIILLFCVSGCANRVEINERSMVLGVGIDKPMALESSASGADEEDSDEASEEEENSEEEDMGTGEAASTDYIRIPPPTEDQMPRYAMTIEAPLVGNIASDSSGGGSEGVESVVVTSTGNTLWEIERSLGLRLGRENFYGHLAVIVISDEVARGGLEPVLDFFTRRRDVLQNIPVVISNGEARKVMEVIPEEEQSAGIHLNTLLSSVYRTGSKINSNMLDIRRSLVSTGNAVLPRVRASSSTEMTVGGGAVIKDWKLRGWLSELETSGYNLITGADNISGGGLSVVDPKDRKQLITSLIRKYSVKTKVTLENGHPVYTIKVVSEWDIVEKGSDLSTWNVQYIRQIERLIESELERRIITVIDKMQREFKADIFGFGVMLLQRYPDYWKSVETQWDDKYFPQIKVTVDPSVKIRRTESQI